MSHYEVIFLFLKYHLCLRPHTETIWMPPNIHIHVYLDLKNYKSFWILNRFCFSEKIKKIKSELRLWLRHSFAEKNHIRYKKQDWRRKKENKEGEWSLFWTRLSILLSDSTNSAKFSYQTNCDTFKYLLFYYWIFFFNCSKVIQKAVNLNIKWNFV